MCARPSPCRFGIGFESRLVPFGVNRRGSADRFRYAAASYTSSPPRIRSARCTNRSTAVKLWLTNMTVRPRLQPGILPSDCSLRRRVPTEGRTVIFVSHSLTAVERLCQRAPSDYAGGELVYDAAASETVCATSDGLRPKGTSRDLEAYPNRQGDGRAHITQLEILDPIQGRRWSASPSVRILLFACTTV